MPGFLICRDKFPVELRNAYQENCITEEIENREFTIKRNTLNKFLDDKAFRAAERYITILEGVLLNKKSLFSQYHVSSVADLMEKMYEKEGETFFSSFRGSFSGAIYSRQQKTWIIFTNHVGDKHIYYYGSQNFFAAGSQVNYIADVCRAANRRLSFNEQSAYKLLTFAFMDNSDTLANEIKRLAPGHYLRCDNHGTVCLKYFTFHKNTDKYAGLCEDELCEIVDSKFKKAVASEYDKDDEYGYSHLADISGGLDSRMAMWVAHELEEDRHIYLKTYGGAGCLDEMISKEVAIKWKDELFVKPQNDASFLYDADIMTEMTNGVVLYSASTGMHRTLRQLNPGMFGLNHMGQLGDVILGSYINDIRRMNVCTGRYSEKLADRLACSAEKDYDDHELYLLYTRGFRGILGTQPMISNFFEPVSPFLDVDFFQTCLDIPLEYRVGHRLYKKWIRKKYAQAADIKWEKMNAKISDSDIKLKMINVSKRIENKMERMLKVPPKYTRHGMNPLDYWYHQNPSIRKFFDEYFWKGRELIGDLASPGLYDDLTALFESGSVIEKTMAMTLESAAKLYFS